MNRSSLFGSGREATWETSANSFRHAVDAGFQVRLPRLHFQRPSFRTGGHRIKDRNPFSISVCNRFLVLAREADKDPAAGFRPTPDGGTLSSR